MKIYILIILSLIHLSCASRVHVNSVYDGDTFNARIDNLQKLIGNNISIRIRGIDAPEIRGKNNHLATKAREYLRDRIKHARSIELRNIEKDKYFRLLADVYIDNESISEVMIKEGLARQYDGGKRKEW